MKTRGSITNKSDSEKSDYLKETGKEWEKMNNSPPARALN